MTNISEEPDWRAGRRRDIPAPHPYDDPDPDYEGPISKPVKKSFWRPASVIVGLAILGSASAFAWRTFYGSAITSLGSLGQETKSPKNELDDRLNGLQTLQQQMINQSQSMSQLLTAQQTEIKRLADQVVALSTKIDGLRSLPEPTHLPVPVVPAQKKHAPKPAAEPSVGGAPLAPPVQLSH